MGELTDRSGSGPEIDALRADVARAVATAPGAPSLAVASALVRAVGRAGGFDVGLPDVGVEPVSAVLDLDVPPSLAEAHGPELLGILYEAALAPDARDAGAHYTPADVAARLVGLVAGPDAPLRPGARVWDPACGAGAFLLAAADALLAAGGDPREIVAEQLWGTDTDPGAVAIAEAALTWWARRHSVGAPLRPELAVADPLLDLSADADGPLALAEAAGYDLVVGNPPFQGQLAGASVRSVATTAALRARWGDDVVRPYTDTATLFLVAAARALAPGGRLLLVQPTSLLAARDAAPARRAAEQVAALTGLWVAREQVFGASVQVCAVVLERPADGPGAPDPVAGRAPVRRWRGRGVDALPTATGRTLVGAGTGPGSWAGYALAALGVPDPRTRSSGTLADLVTARAGFREEYYGLVGHVAEAPEGLGDDPDDLPAGWAPLVTAGLVDPGRCSWGRRPASFARQRYQRPVVDLASLASSTSTRAASWVRALAVPKGVVATQTRVGEAAVDRTGAWVASTPTVALVADPDRLWHVAAVVCSPVGSIAALAATAGSGRAGDAIRQSVASTSGLPLPVDHDAWAAGADALCRLDRPAFLDAMAEAYGLTAPAEVDDWWQARAPWSD